MKYRGEVRTCLWGWPHEFNRNLMLLRLQRHPFAELRQRSIAAQ